MLFHVDRMESICFYFLEENRLRKYTNMELDHRPMVIWKIFLDNICIYAVVTLSKNKKN